MNQHSPDKTNATCGSGPSVEASSQTNSLRYGLLVAATPTGSALLAAALLISAFVLLRYWRSLDGYSERTRRSLVVLRGLALVLISLALAGLSFDYDTNSHPRVLLVSSRSNKPNGDDQSRNIEKDENAALTTALRREGFEVVDESQGVVESANGAFAAAVLLTDGAISSSEAGSTVERASQRIAGAPVYAVAKAPDARARRLSLKSVSVVGPVLRGVPVAVRCTIHSRGMKGRESLITVSDDAKVQSSAKIAWTGDDDTQSVSLTLVPKVSGWVAYSAKVEGAGDESATQLSRSFTVLVEDRKLRVLFFEGEPDWESKFVRRALDESGLFDVDYFAQVSRAAGVGASTTNAEQPIEDTVQSGVSPEIKLHAILRSPAGLNAYDSVIIGATPNSLLSATESARIATWVERRGGGLIVLGGNNFNGSIAVRGGKLAALLPSDANTQNSAALSQPVSVGHPLEAEKTVSTLVLTPTEAGAAVLAGYQSATDNTRGVALSGQGLYLGALSPGAMVLAVAGTPNADGTSNEGRALVAGMNYGAGRTLVFAPADSWRMRTSAGGGEDRNAGQFNSLWQGLVLWTGARSGPASEIVLSDETPGEGSEITAEIRVRDTSFAPVRIDRLNARIERLNDTADEEAGQDSDEIAFVPDAVDPSVWRARLSLSAQGKFAIRADYVAAGRPGFVEKQFAVSDGITHAPESSFDTLRRTSRETGGDLVMNDGFEVFAKDLSLRSTNSERVHRTWEIRSFWPLVVIIPLLLSTEWFLRRWWRVD